ncbi:MAG: hypothetical protein JW817_05820 [Clostridiales bacterium]|nr:hypothetical protein [Clostridiales bacterium]
MIALTLTSATRTSAYFAIAPFIGVLMSFIIFGQRITWWFVIASDIISGRSHENHFHTDSGKLER